MVHCHTVHLARGALLTPYAMCVAQVANAMDVYVTGAGTSCFWCLFLRPGAVCLQLGQVAMLYNSSTPAHPPRGYPHYGEESIMSSNRYARTIYPLSPQQLLLGYTQADLELAFDHALTIVRSRATMVHSLTVHLPLGALLSPCAMSRTGEAGLLDATGALVEPLSGW